MSFFQNVREKFAAKFKTNSPDEPNPYYEGYLRGEQKEALFGYDYHHDDVVMNVFNNLDTYGDILEEVGIDIDKIDQTVLAENKDYELYADGDLEEMSAETKVMLAIRHIIDDWSEMKRNEFVTSLIENMSEEEYKKGYLDVWGSVEGLE